MPSLRYADPQTLTQYPLEISSTADWQPEGAMPDDAPERARTPAPVAGWQFSVELGPLPKGEMIAPSLSLLDAPDHRYLFSLEADGKTFDLAPIPPRAEDKNRRGHSSEERSQRERERKATVRTAIDCFHVERKVRRARLHCSLQTATPPSRYLLTISIRPTEIRVAAPGSLPRTMATPPASISQMLQNPRIASRVCSPVATAMVLAAHRNALKAAGRQSVATEHVIDSCHDPVSGMYGLWPLAIRSAANAGLIGAVELFSDWTPALQCLSAGLPLVASIRYGAGELPGAPMPATAGHLVVVAGVDDKDVLVNDPAAPNHGTVSRRYPLEAFSRAWFRHRGAVYIVGP